jgi:hypothetical protein|nr:MAG TPA: hypothetical protein [Bacteriophage sp.]
MDSDGRETTEVTSTKAYDYNYYWNGQPSSGIDKLPPTPDG